MEFAQERVATLHDLTGADPDAPTDDAAVVVPMTAREHASLAAERVLTELEAVDPARVVVALRAPPDRVGTMRDWLEGYDLPLELLWCNAPAVDRLLDGEGLGGEFGKGRDVWLALGVAAREADYVVVHDADATTYSGRHVRRLLAPLDRGFEFSKGYYARVENGQLYGRLCRLFYEPLVRALADAHDEPVLEYLGAFRYALSGEFAATADLATKLRAQRAWGLEVGTLGEAFAHAGVAGSAQVDLGRHEHDHRSVSGSSGLSGMCEQVADALFRALADHGVSPAFETLPARYREVAEEFLSAYAADAAFNGLSYDREGEREQVATYAEAIDPPGADRRLPAWRDAPFDAEAVRAATTASLADVADVARPGED
jgi:glucosyl-3-phosphoglycerate synthase